MFWNTEKKIVLKYEKIIPTGIDSPKNTHAKTPGFYRTFNDLGISFTVFQNNCGLYAISLSIA